MIYALIVSTRHQTITVLRNKFEQIKFDFGISLRNSIRLFEIRLRVSRAELKDRVSGLIKFYYFKSCMWAFECYFYLYYFSNSISF